MLNKILITLIIFTILASSIVVADRPDYDYTYDPFMYLEPFPDDFYEIKELFDTQRVTATHLSENYYQPELIPGWQYSHKFYEDENDDFGCYGFFFYPSRLDVSDAREGMIINVSTFIYADFGVQFYQGTKLYITDNPDYEVTTSIDDKNILLSPTAPYFKPNWIQTINITIKILNETDGYVFFKELNPDPYFSDMCEEDYPGNYIYGHSLLGAHQKKFTIHIDAYEEPVITSEENIDIKMVTVMFISLGFLIFIGILYWRRYLNEKADMD